MKIKLPSYPDYSIDTYTMEVFNDKRSKPVTLQENKSLKLKDLSGRWRAVQLSSVREDAGLYIQIPSDAVEIPNSNGKYYIDTMGRVYSFSLSKCGTIIKQGIGSSGYPRVSIFYKGKNRIVEVHQLMCASFILSDYVERGLVCLHSDNNKLNCSLSNLSVGTYSKNNKDAYSDGLNPGNGLKAKRS